MTDYSESEKALKTALQAAQATPLEQARVYLFQNLRTLERNAKPKGVAVQVRIAVEGFVRQSEQARSILADELAASRHHATGLKSHNDELLDYQNVLRNAFDNQQTLTRNALIESRNMADARYELEGQVRELKQQNGDAPAAQDVIDRLRKNLTRHEGLLKVANQVISDQSDTILELEDGKRAAAQRISEVHSDVRNAESYSDKLSEQLKQKDVVNKSMGAECDLLTGELERQKETANAYRIERDSLQSQLAARDETIRHLRITKEGLEGSVQRLMDLNGELREAAGIAGDHVRAQNEAVGVIYETLTDAQAQLTEYLIGNVSERETLGRLLGILDNGLINEAMRSFDASPGDENCELCDVLNAKDA